MRITNTLTIELATTLRDSADPAADGVIAEELWALHEHLSAALHPLNAVLTATAPAPGDPEWLGAGRPRRPVRVADPGEGSVKGLLAIPGLAVGITVWSLGMAAATVTRESRGWWRGSRGRRGLDRAASG